MPDPIGPPTPEDLARDAVADMAACDTATPGPWLIECVANLCSKDYAPNGEHIRREHDRVGADQRFPCIARDALPAWIRRCTFQERAHASVVGDVKTLNQVYFASTAVLHAEIARLQEAIRIHHAQKADDRCIEDDDRLYAAAGLPRCDRRVGSKEAMLANCARFIERRCEGGYWPSYIALEKRVLDLEELVRHCRVHSGYADCGAAQMTTDQKAMYQSIISATEL